MFLKSIGFGDDLEAVCCMREAKLEVVDMTDLVDNVLLSSCNEVSSSSSGIASVPSPKDVYWSARLIPSDQGVALLPDKILCEARANIL